LRRALKRRGFELQRRRSRHPRARGYRLYRILVLFTNCEIGHSELRDYYFTLEDVEHWLEQFSRSDLSSLSGGNRQKPKLASIDADDIRPEVEAHEAKCITALKEYWVRIVSVIMTSQGSKRARPTACGSASNTCRCG
jgi:hypothetical protein